MDQHSLVIDLFIRGWKLDISLVVVTQSYFLVLKEVRVKTTHVFIINIKKKNELQIRVINHSSDTDFDEFKRLYGKSILKLCSVLTIETTLS